MTSHNMKVYVDDIMIKSKFTHLDDLCVSFEQIRMYNLKINPLNYVFGVQISNFMGFLVHQQGIKMEKNKARTIVEA